MVIAQFWAFATDLYTEEQGKRLFPLIGVGSSLGAWVGSMRAGQLVESFGPATAARSAAPAFLVVCVALGADRRPGQRAHRRRRAGHASTRSSREARAASAMILSRPLPAAHRGARAAAERRQHVRRVPVRPLRRRGCRTKPTERPAGGAAGVHRRDATAASSATST